MSADFDTLRFSHDLYAQANEAVEHGHLGKASKIIREALSESQALDQLLVVSATALAERYLSAGDHAAAASIYRAILSAKSKQLGNSHPEVVELNRKLASALWHIGGLTPTSLATDQ
jgi:hypothetical protein